MELSEADGTQMFILGDCFIVVIGPIHEASMKNAVLHGEGMAELMIDYFA